MTNIRSDNQQTIVSSVWNDPLTSYTNLKVDVLNLACSSPSRLLDIQNNGISVFNVDNTGLLTVSGNSGIKSAGNIRIWSTGNASVIIRNLDNTQTRFNFDTAGGQFTLVNGSNQPVILQADTTDTLAQRNGVAAQNFRIYNTYTDANNYERAGINWNASTFSIGTEASGTGSVRNLSINTSGLSRIYVTSGGYVGIGLTNPTALLHVSGGGITVTTPSDIANTGNALNISGVWNTTSTPTLVKIEASSVNSGTNSRLLDIVHNGASKLYMFKGGGIIFSPDSGSNLNLVVNRAFVFGNQDMSLQTGLSNNGVIFASSLGLYWASGSTYITALDTAVTRLSPGTVQVSSNLLALGSVSATTVSGTTIKAGSGGFNASGLDGITQVVTILDGNTVNTHNITITNGIITAYTKT